jgi:ABC-type transport system involved in multi-copper enzyme maturation permease subunit
MMIDTARVRAVVRKERREYRRNRFIIGTMAVLPVIFLILPVVGLVRLPASASISTVHAQVGSAFLLMLLIPVIVPATIAAYSVIGEREQGTLEPLLTTPLSSDELLLGKAWAAILPAVGITYVLFAAVVLTVRVGASAAVVSAVWQAPLFLAQLLFAPLLAAWSIGIGTAISARSSDVRVAQQLGTLASLPALGITALISFRVINPSVPLAIALGVALVVLDGVAWRAAAAVFDRERLILGKARKRRTQRDRER